MAKLTDFRNETWEQDHDGRLAIYEVIVGNSGVYIIVTDKETGETLRDDRPWQMREGQS